MTELIHIPFEGGISDSGDPVVIGGKLYQATNVRFRKQGRAAKKYGYAIEQYTGLTGTPNALGDFKGVGYVASDFQLVTGVRTIGNVNSSNITVPGRMSRVLPNRIDPVSIDPTRGGPAVRCDMTSLTSSDFLRVYYVYAWDQGSEFGYSIRTTGDNVLLFQKEQLAGSMVRAIATDKTYLVHRNGTSLVYESVSADTFVLSGSTTIGTLSASSSVYDAAGDGGNTFYAAYQSSATQLTVKRVVNGTVTATAVPVVGTVCKAITVCAVSSGVYIAYIDANNFAQSIAYDAALTTLIGPTVIDNNPAKSYYGQPGVVAYSATKVLVIINGKDTTPGTNSRYCRSQLITVSTLALDHAMTQFWHVSLASHPFASGGGVALQRFCAWFSTDNDLPLSLVGGAYSQGVAGWTNQRTYWMLDLLDEDNVATSTPNLIMNGSPLVGFVNEIGGSPLMLPKICKVVDPFVVPLLDVVQPRPALANTGLNTDLTMIKALSWYDSLSNSPAGSYRRDSVLIDDAVHFSGGFLTEYTGSLNESGFMHYPVIVGATYTAGSIAAVSGMYSYTACFEWIDLQGRRHRSQPGDPLTLPVGPNVEPRLFVSTLAAGKATENVSFDTGGVMVALYRTTAGGSTYYKTTPHMTSSITAAPNANSPVVTIDDPNSDAVLVTHEILYTMGGVLGNIVPPAAKFLATGGGRVWLAGLFETRRVALSKTIVHGEPVQFPDDDTFRIDLPDDITGIKWGDGTLIVFTQQSIYLISGDGPNDQGIGQFSLPQRLPSDVGCVEHFSIVETQNGWLFLSQRGFYMLPRGFGPPVFVGADIQESFDIPNYQGAGSSQIYTGALVEQTGETTVRYVIVSTATGSTAVLVWDTTLQKWISRDTWISNTIGVHSNNAAFVLGLSAGSMGVIKETAASWAGASGVYAETHLRTGNLRPFGFLGYGRIEKIQVHGEIRGNCLLNMQVIRDGSDIQTMPAVGKTGAQGAKFFHQFMLPDAQCNSIDVEVWDSAPTTIPTGASEGLVFHGLTLEVDPYEGLPRLGEADRS